MYKKDENETPRSSFLPLFGFIVIVIIAILAWFFSPNALDWLTTTTFPTRPPHILPLVFPANWTEITSRLVVTFFVFAFFFMIFLIIWLALIPVDRDKEKYGEYSEYVKTGKVSKKIKKKNKRNYR